MVALIAGSTEEPAWTTVHTSAGGVTWERTTTLTGVRLRELTVAGRGLVAVGSRETPSGGTTPVVATSIDGRRWDLHDLDTRHGGVLRDVTATTTGVLAVGATFDETGVPRPASWTSFDGVTWTTGAPITVDGAGATLERVASLGDAVVAVGRVPTDADNPGPMLAWRRTAETGWRSTPTPANWGSVLLGDLTAGPAGAVLVGTPGGTRTPTAWRTVDGRSWSIHPLPVLSDTDSSFAIDVAASSVRYVAVGDDVDFAEDLGPATGRPAVWTSDDAVSWRRVPLADLEGPVLQAGSNAERVVVHNDGWLAYGTTSAAADMPPTWVLWRGDS